jgi:Predicted hydrolase (metallo-beta-lactamase superfamily)
MKRRVKLVMTIVVTCILLIGIAFIGMVKYNPVKWTLTQYNDLSGSQAMCYTLTSNRGKLIVIDGGWEQNTDQVRKIIKENGSTVDAWILTHPHPDHIGAFNNIYADAQGIKIKKIYDSDVDYKIYKPLAQAWDQIEVYERYLAQTKNDTRIHHLHRGDKLKIDKLKFEVFNSYDKLNKSFDRDFCNINSLMFKVSTKKDSILFCGDSRTDAESDYLIKRFGKKLKANYVQMGHHGNATLSDAFYKVVSPKIALFDAPDWLVTGEQFTTPKEIKYMKSLGAKIYVYASAPNKFILK